MHSNQQEIFLLIRVWNGYNYLTKCLESVFSQKYSSKFTIICIDDYSDYSKLERRELSKLLKNHIYIRNSARKYSVYNAYFAHKNYIPNNAIVINLDGDDWFSHQYVVEHVKSLYQDKSCWLTYGGCEYFLGNKQKELQTLPLPTHAPHRYNESVERDSSYRTEFFLPIHLRTWRAALFKRIQRKDLLRNDGSWLQFCEDQAFYFPMLEMAAGKYHVTTSTLYTYNLETKFSDHILYRKQKFLDELLIRAAGKYTPLNEMY